MANHVADTFLSSLVYSSFNNFLVSVGHVKILFLVTFMQRVLRFYTTGTYTEYGIHKHEYTCEQTAFIQGTLIKYKYFVFTFCIRRFSQIFMVYQIYLLVSVFLFFVLMNDCIHVRLIFGISLVLKGAPLEELSIVWLIWLALTSRSNLVSLVLTQDPASVVSFLCTTSRPALQNVTLPPHICSRIPVSLSISFNYLGHMSRAG